MNLSHLFELKKANFTFFGWLSIAITIVSIPYFFVIFALSIANPDLAEGNVIGSLIAIVYTLLYVAVFHFFRKLLNQRYKFTNADREIRAFVYLNILLTVGIEVLSYMSDLDIMLAVLSLALLIPLGILSIAIGIKLLSLDATLHGMKKSLSINLIASGILYASVILFLIALIPSLIATALMGVIFLREANIAKTS